ncbi:MAG: 4Fe-4S ferredoxin [Chloroflexi bacterium]|nr:4Fe-4S ferredoxin [Chloroflexota bacterium]
MQELVQAIREEARRLLETGQVELVIGFAEGTLPMHSAPVFVRQVADTNRLTWNSFAENNLARYLRGVRNKKVAIVAKGCDVRAIVALINEHQLERDNVYIIGVPCRGMMDRRVVTRRVPGEVAAVREEGDELVVDVRTETGTAPQVVRLPRSELLHRSCATCIQPNPVIYDVLAAEPVEVWAVDPYAYVREMERRSPAERAAYFAAEAARCIRCYACRQACPMCYCEECFVDHTAPRWIESGATASGLQGWQIGRAYHLTGRCVDCGACERACPTEIDLVYLNGKLRKDVWDLYGFEPGMGLGQLPPLAVFLPDEGPEFRP